MASVLSLTANHAAGKPSATLPSLSIIRSLFANTLSHDSDIRDEATATLNNHFHQNRKIVTKKMNKTKVVRILVPKFCQTVLQFIRDPESATLDKDAEESKVVAKVPLSACTLAASTYLKNVIKKGWRKTALHATKGAVNFRCSLLNAIFTLEESSHSQTTTSSSSTRKRDCLQLVETARIILKQDSLLPSVAAAAANKWWNPKDSANPESSQESFRNFLDDHRKTQETWDKALPSNAFLLLLNNLVKTENNSSAGTIEQKNSFKNDFRYSPDLIKDLLNSFHVALSSSTDEKEASLFTMNNGANCHNLRLGLKYLTRVLKRLPSSANEITTYVLPDNEYAKLLGFLQSLIKEMNRLLISDTSKDFLSDVEGREEDDLMTPFTRLLKRGLQLLVGLLNHATNSRQASERLSDPSKPQTPVFHSLLKDLSQLIRNHYNSAMASLLPQRVLALSFEIFQITIDTRKGTLRESAVPLLLAEYNTVSDAHDDSAGSDLLRCGIFPALILRRKDKVRWEEDEDEFIRRCLPLDLDHDLQQQQSSSSSSGSSDGGKDEEEDYTKSFTARKAAIQLLTRLAFIKSLDKKKIDNGLESDEEDETNGGEDNEDVEDSSSTKRSGRGNRKNRGKKSRKHLMKNRGKKKGSSNTGSSLKKKRDAPLTILLNFLGKTKGDLDRRAQEIASLTSEDKRKKKVFEKDWESIVFGICIAKGALTEALRIRMRLTGARALIASEATSLWLPLIQALPLHKAKATEIMTNKNGSSQPSSANKGILLAFPSWRAPPSAPLAAAALWSLTACVRAVGTKSDTHLLTLKGAMASTFDAALQCITLPNSDDCDEEDVDQEEEDDQEEIHYCPSGGLLDCLGPVRMVAADFILAALHDEEHFVYEEFLPEEDDDSEDESSKKRASKKKNKEKANRDYRLGWTVHSLLSLYPTIGGESSGSSSDALNSSDFSDNNCGEEDDLVIPQIPLLLLSKAIEVADSYALPYCTVIANRVVKRCLSELKEMQEEQLSGCDDFVDPQDFGELSTPLCVDALTCLASLCDCIETNISECEDLLEGEEEEEENDENDGREKLRVAKEQRKNVAEYVTSLFRAMWLHDLTPNGADYDESSSQLHGFLLHSALNNDTVREEAPDLSGYLADIGATLPPLTQYLPEATSLLGFLCRHYDTTSNNDTDAMKISEEEESNNKDHNLSKLVSHFLARLPSWQTDLKLADTEWKGIARIIRTFSMFWNATTTTTTTQETALSSMVLGKNAYNGILSFALYLIANLDPVDVATDIHSHIEALEGGVQQLIKGEGTTTKISAFFPSVYAKSEPSDFENSASLFGTEILRLLLDWPSFFQSAKEGQSSVEPEDETGSSSTRKELLGLLFYNTFTRRVLYGQQQQQAAEDTSAEMGTESSSKGKNSFTDLLLSSLVHSFCLCYLRSPVASLQLLGNNEVEMNSDAELALDTIEEQAVNNSSSSQASCHQRMPLCIRAMTSFVNETVTKTELSLLTSSNEDTESDDNGSGARLSSLVLPLTLLSFSSIASGVKKVSSAMNALLDSQEINFKSLLGINKLESQDGIKGAIQFPGNDERFKKALKNTKTFMKTWEKRLNKDNADDNDESDDEDSDAEENNSEDENSSDDENDENDSEGEDSDDDGDDMGEEDFDDEEEEDEDMEGHVGYHCEIDANMISELQQELEEFPLRSLQFQTRLIKAVISSL
eukprot:g1297.t1